MMIKKTLWHVQYYLRTSAVEYTKTRRRGEGWKGGGSVVVYVTHVIRWETRYHKCMVCGNVHVDSRYKKKKTKEQNEKSKRKVVFTSMGQLKDRGRWTEREGRVITTVEYFFLYFHIVRTFLYDSSFDIVYFIQTTRYLRRRKKITYEFPITLSRPTALSEAAAVVANNISKKKEVLQSGRG